MEQEVNSKTTNKTSLIFGYLAIVVAIIGFFISFNGVVSIVALVLTFIALYNCGECRKSAKVAFIALTLSVIGLAWVTLNMFGVI